MYGIQIYHLVHDNPIFLQNLRFVGAMVIEFHFFNQIIRREEGEQEQFGKICYEYYTHIYCDRVNFYGDLHLDVSRC